MKKVVHIVESFSGGVFDFIVDLVNNLENIEHVIIYGVRGYTPIDVSSCFIKNNVEFIEWEDVGRELNPYKDLKALNFLFKSIKSINNFDVLHLHSSKAGFLGRIVARFHAKGKVVIYTPHGVSFLRRDISSLKRYIYIALERIGNSFSGKVVACSKSEANVFIDVGIDVTYINNGYKIESENKTKREADLKKIKIGTIGRVVYQKNPSLFNVIAEHFQDSIEFVWIGEGMLSTQLTSPNITITGWMTKDEVLKYLETIDIYLSTSLWEGLPLSVLSAMGNKKPLILSNCVGNKDLVVDNINGYLFEDEKGCIDKINYLINNIEKLNQFGESSYEILKENFSMDQMLSSYVSMYNKE